MKHLYRAMAISAITMLAPLAQASFSFSTAGGDCFGQTTGNVNLLAGTVCSTTLLPQMPDGANGLHSTGTASAVSADAASFQLSIIWDGSADGGTYTGELPVHWDFDVNFTGTGNYTWELTFGLNNNAFARGIGGVGSGDQSFQGSDAFNLSNLAVLNWNVNLTVTTPDTTLSGDQLFITVPDGSLDYNTSENPSTPEPASLLLGASGLGLLIWRRSR